MYVVCRQVFRHHKAHTMAVVALSGFFCILDELLLSIYDDDGFLVSDRFQLAIIKYENCICHC